MKLPPRVYRSLQEADPSCPRALTIGNFDGVHAGHRLILRRAAAMARERGWRAAAMTFHPHPAVLVAPQRAPRLLTSPEQRVSLMAEEGIEEVFILPFVPAFAHLTPRQFTVEVLMRGLGVKAVLVGSNFRFGYQHAGDVHELSQLGAELGFQTEIIPQVRLRGTFISSSHIRALIESGAVTKAARLLQRHYWVEGPVVSGRRIGSTTTVPTLNLATPSEVLPATGVYITLTQDVDRNLSWPSVTNIGFRPTFGSRELSIETHLLTSLTGEDPVRIRLNFLWRLREERKFPDAPSLRAQILRDVARSLRYFRLRERLLYSKGTPF